MPRAMVTSLMWIALPLWTTSTVLIKAKLTDAGVAVNPLQLVCFIEECYVVQKAWIQTLETRCNNDARRHEEGCRATTSYGPALTPNSFADDQKVIFIRDDNYWGKDASMWGKLPVPKYIAHT